MVGIEQAVRRRLLETGSRRIGVVYIGTIDLLRKTLMVITIVGVATTLSGNGTHQNLSDMLL